MNKKTIKKSVKRVNKPKAKKTTTKKNVTKKSTSKAKKKVNKKPTKKKIIKKSAKKAVKAVKKEIVKKSKKDKWANITITESGEIIDKTEKKETGITDEYGNWNGSIRSDEAINAVKNKEEKKLLEEIDKLQEEVRRARENDEDDYYIAGMIQDIRMKEARIHEIHYEEQWGSLNKK